MLGGTGLIRRKLGKDAYAMTITPLLNSEGKKMGKTEKVRVWLDAEKTDTVRVLPVLAERFDQDVIKSPGRPLNSFVPIEQIEEMERTLEGQRLNQAKELLAYELTALVHGRKKPKRHRLRQRLSLAAAETMRICDHRSESGGTHRRRHRDPDLDGTAADCPRPTAKHAGWYSRRRFCE